jgi:hypothetical protein
MRPWVQSLFPQKEKKEERKKERRKKERKKKEKETEEGTCSPF